MVDDYYKAGAPEKARDLAKRYGDALVESATFFLGFYEEAEQEFQYCLQLIYDLTDTLTANGDKELADTFNKVLDDKLKALISKEYGDIDNEPEQDNAGDSL